MGATVFDLVVPQTADNFTATRIALLRSKGFPITAWEEGGVARTIIETDSEISADLSRLVPVVVAGGYTSTATGDWADLLGDSAFDERRKPAVATVGTVRLTDTASVGPQTIDAGDLVVVSDDGVEYESTAAVTVPLNGYATVPVRASVVGVAGNAAVGGITHFGTSRPGLAVSNPALAPTATWITTLGADAEGDDFYMNRCRLKWSSLGSGSNAESYAYFALSSADGIRRVRVVPHLPEAGQVTVFVAGSTGPATPDDFATCSDYIDQKKPLGVHAETRNATPYPLVILGSATVKAAYLDAAKAYVNAQLLAYFASMTLEDPFIAARVDQIVMNAPGSVNFKLLSPTLDVAQPVGACFVLSNFISFVAV